MSPVVYEMKRNDKVAAHVVTLPNGKCIVSWPTSTIVYDSEQHARDVHIAHMGGRGERTVFFYKMASDAFVRGWEVCYQDRCEGCPDACGPKPPHYIGEGDREDYEAGYWACSRAMYGHDYQPIRADRDECRATAQRCVDDEKAAREKAEAEAAEWKLRSENQEKAANAKREAKDVVFRRLREMGAPSARNLSEAVDHIKTVVDSYNAEAAKAEQPEDEGAVVDAQNAEIARQKQRGDEGWAQAVKDRKRADEEQAAREKAEAELAGLEAEIESHIPYADSNDERSDAEAMLSPTECVEAAGDELKRLRKVEAEADELREQFKHEADTAEKLRREILKVEGERDSALLQLSEETEGHELARKKLGQMRMDLEQVRASDPARLLRKLRGWAVEEGRSADLMGDDEWDKRSLALSDCVVEIDRLLAEAEASPASGGEQQTEVRVGLEVKGYHGDCDDFVEVDKATGEIVEQQEAEADDDAPLRAWLNEHSHEPLPGLESGQIQLWSAVAELCKRELRRGGAK